jgi:hypothetical protein
VLDQAVSSKVAAQAAELVGKFPLYPTVDLS